MVFATSAEMTPKRPGKPREFARLMLLLGGALAVFALLGTTLGAIADCSAIPMFDGERLCRMTPEDVPVTLFYVPPLLALMVIMAWRKWKRGAD